MFGEPLLPISIICAPVPTCFILSDRSSRNFLVVSSINIIRGSRKRCRSFAAAPSATTATSSPKIDQISVRRFKGATFVNATSSPLFTPPYPIIPPHETKPLGCRQVVTTCHHPRKFGVWSLRAWLDGEGFNVQSTRPIFSILPHAVLAMATSVNV